MSSRQAFLPSPITRKKGKQLLNEEIGNRIDLLGNSLNPEVVGLELLKAEVVSDLRGLHLEAIPRNPERRDFLTRASFRVSIGSRTVCHLTVGSNLEELWKRSRDFAAACPEITARPLFLHRTPRVDYLGLEFIEGADLETLALQGELEGEKARALIGELVSGLESTLQDSDHSAASAELEALFASLCDSPVFSGLDQQFLQDFVFPFIRKGALASPSRTRWTNGDFIPRNVRIDQRGRPRIVDYEFACRTHFHREDSWRWAFFNRQLPASIRNISPFGDVSQMGNEWLEGYSLLRQIKLCSEINGSVLAMEDAAYTRDRLLRLASAYHNDFRSSLFLRPIFSQLDGVGEKSPDGISQLFWGADGSFSEERSCRLHLPFNGMTFLRFKLTVPPGPLRLRLDPIDGPGLICIKALRVYSPRSDQTLLTMSGETGWQGLRAFSGLIRLPDTPEFNFLSLGNDPILLLPDLDITVAEGELAVDLSVRFTPKLDGLSNLLALPSPAELALLDDSKAVHVDLAALRALLDRETLVHQQTAAELGRTSGLLSQLEEVGRNQVAQLESAIVEAQLLRARLTDAIAKGEGKEALCLAKEAELVTATGALAKRQAEVEQANSQLASLEAVVAELRGEITRGVQIGNGHKVQLESTQSEMRVLRARLMDAIAKAEAEEAFRLAKERELATVAELLAARQAETTQVADRLKATEAILAQLRSEFDNAQKAFEEVLQRRSDEVAMLTTDNQTASQTQLELRERLAAAELWLGNLKNRALVKMSLAIHREQWPL
jgi:hypothetical protein